MSELVAPIVPNAQENLGAGLLLQGLGQGLASFARFSQMKRDSEMELLKLAEHERVSQEHDALEREKMAADADYRNKTLEVTSELNQAHIGLFNSQADAWKNGTARAWQNTAAFNQQKEALVNEVNDSANELKLNDPVFATKNPVAYAANVMKFKDMYELSPMPDVRKAIEVFQRTADQQTISLKMNVDEYGAATGEPQPVPVWQIVQKMKDPEQLPQIIKVLQANGQMKIAHAMETIGEPSPELMRALEQGKGVEFERRKSRVPVSLLPKSAAPGTSGPTAMPQTYPLPDPDLPPIDGEPQAAAKPLSFEQSDTDKLIAQAKAAIAQGAPKDRVLARLQEMGIGSEALA